MTTYTVSTSSQLTSTLNLAKAGDSIVLAAGNYGAVSISKQFATDVTITAQTEGSAVFKSLTLNDSSHLKIDGVAVNFTPTASTYAWTPAVGINGSSDITFTHSTVTGGAAVTGVAQTATHTDSSGNVLGLATGYGISVSGSSNVKVDDNEVSNFFKGVSLYKSDYVTVAHNDVHDTRTTSVVVAGGNHIAIDANHLHDVNPWAWNTSYGDHGDFLAMWTNSGQVSASTDIKVTNNLMEQGAGRAVLGMWMQGGAANFTGVTISGNAILNGNYQGILLWDVTGGTIDHNTLLQTSGTDWKSQPGVILGGGSEKISVHDNKVGSIEDKSASIGSLANTVFNNILVTKWTSGLIGSYANDLIAKTEALYDTIVDAGTSVSTPVVTAPTAPTTSTGTTSGATSGASTGTATTTPTDTATTGTAGSTIVGAWDAKSLVGGSGADSFISKSGHDILTGGAGNDTYTFSASQTKVVEAANGGADTVVVKGDYTLTANVENLTISTAANNNWAGTGNNLNNVITGNVGGNYLDGAAGNDTIYGGAGADVITGNVGNDLLVGGAGKDTFKFASGSGQDRIADFSKADHDVIDVSAFTKAGYKAVLADVGMDVKISFATGDAIVLTGVHAKDLIATSAGFTA